MKERATSDGTSCRSGDLDGPPSLRTPARYRTEDLFKGGQEVVITHGNEDYRLRITRNDKLILTK